MFFMKITGTFERYRYFNFETNFLENAKPFQKTGKRFLGESTRIENAIFPYKIALTQANVKGTLMQI